MSIVRAARDDRPASHLPSPAVAVPQPRRPEPASCAARPAAVGANAAPRPARPAAPSRQHVRAVLTGSPRSARSAPRLRIVRPSDQPAAYRPGAPQPGQPPVPSSEALARPADAPARPGQTAARPGAGQPAVACSAAPRSHPGRPVAAEFSAAWTSTARFGLAASGASRASAVQPSTVQPSTAAPRSLRAGSPTAVRPCSAPPAGLRLTRRGRLVVSVFALALILGLITILWATLAGGAQAASGRSHTGSVYQGLRRVTVLPGQTLWAIAHQAEPSADPRTVIPQIMQINAISSTELQPGQQLWVPRA